MTDDGYIWDTWERDCWTDYNGNASWYTYELEKVITQKRVVDGKTEISLQHVWKTVGCQMGPGHARECATQSTCPWNGQQPNFGAPSRRDAKADRPRAQGYVTDYMSVPSYHSILNSYTEASSFWDRTPFPIGSALDMQEYAAGPHRWFVVPNNPAVHDSLDLTINIVPSFAFIFLGGSSDSVPGASVAFINMTPNPVDAIFSLENLPAGINGYISSTAQNVGPNVQYPVTGWLEMQPGVFMPVGGAIPGRFVARDNDGDLLASIQVSFIVPPGPTAISPPVAITAFHGARPNPLSTSARIAFELGTGGRVRIDVFDATGRQVRRLVDAVHNTGMSTVVWEGVDDAGRRVAPGVYVMQADLGDRRYTQRLILLQ
jgi:hypothetical protein